MKQSLKSLRKKNMPSLQSRLKIQRAASNAQSSALWLNCQNKSNTGVSPAPPVPEPPALAPPAPEPPALAPPTSGCKLKWCKLTNCKDMIDSQVDDTPHYELTSYICITCHGVSSSPDRNYCNNSYCTHSELVESSLEPVFKDDI